MEYLVDLTRKNKKQPWIIILGALFLLFTFAKIAEILLSSKDGNKIADWLLVLCFFYQGIYWLTVGLDKPFDSYFGKAYVKINQDAIIVKPNIFKKEKMVEWENVSSVEYCPQTFFFSMLDNSQIQFDIGNFDYEIIKGIKDSISDISKLKNIPVKLG